MEKPRRYLGVCYADAIDRDELPSETVMLRVEAFFVGAQRVQERWVTAAEVKRSIEDTGLSDADLVRWAMGPRWHGPAVAA